MSWIDGLPASIEHTIPVTPPIVNSTIYSSIILPVVDDYLTSLVYMLLLPSLVSRSTVISRLLSLSVSVLYVIGLSC